MSGTNFALKDEIRSYWSMRAATFDQSVGHRIQDDVEASAWKALFSQVFGNLRGRRALDLACGTGEISRMLLALGADVTGVDFAEPMLERANAKNAGGSFRTRMADVEALIQESDATYDAVVARHLVWTLVDPPAAFTEWRRVLKPGGRLLIMDGDMVNISAWGQMIRAFANRFLPQADDHGRVIDRDAHARILSQVHYRGGLTPDRLAADLRTCGFTDVRSHPIRRIYMFGMRNSPLGTRLRLLAPRRFAISAARPAL